jgi:uncharacterized protein (TIGR02266 family)
MDPDPVRKCSAEDAEVTTVVERRRSPRAPVVVRVEYATIDALFSEFTSNINEGGLFIETDTPADLDSAVHLFFKLPGDDEPLKVAGRVVRVDGDGGEGPPGMGIEFEHLEARDRERINGIVQQLRRG